MRNIYKDIKGGFSLIETITVLGIMTVGMLGVSSVVLQNLKAENVNRNNFIASMLAQEAVELVRQKRDTNWLRGDDWQLGEGAGTDTDIIQDSTYTIDNFGTINQVPNDLSHADTKIFIDSSGYYNHDSSGTDTGYRRLIEIDDFDADTVEFTVTIRWQHRGQANDYEVSSVLYGWF